MKYNETDVYLAVNNLKLESYKAHSVAELVKLKQKNAHKI